MSLAEAGEIFRYWEQSPPPHLMLQTIARMLGWTPQPAPVAAADLATAAPPGLAVHRRGEIGLPPPLDVDALRERNRERGRRRAAASG